MFAAALGIIAALIVYRDGGKAVPTYDTAAEPAAGH
jgi:MHS family citrate/tricarballylate:H+ symporter-like MFS transporter